MIARGSDNTLIEKVNDLYSDFDIAHKYLGITCVPEVINSPLRQDNNPSLGLFINSKTNGLWFKDFGSGEGGYHKDIWIDTMETYLKDKDNTWYKMPDDVVGVMVNPINGQLAKEGDKLSKIFYFLKGTEPTFNNTDLESVFKENNKKKEAT